MLFLQKMRLRKASTLFLLFLIIMGMMNLSMANEVRKEFSTNCCQHSPCSNAFIRVLSSLVRLSRPSKRKKWLPTLLLLLITTSISSTVLAEAQREISSKSGNGCITTFRNWRERSRGITILHRPVRNFCSRF